MIFVIAFKKHDDPEDHPNAAIIKLEANDVESAKELAEKFALENGMVVDAIKLEEDVEIN